jgi:hypothetical protein
MSNLKDYLGEKWAMAMAKAFCKGKGGNVKDEPIKG